MRHSPGEKPYSSGRDIVPESAIDGGLSSKSGTQSDDSEAISHVEYDARAANSDWTAIYNAYVRQDEKMIKGYQEAIDSTLIFAGLFSAVLTAFVIATYPLLQEDQEQITNLILLNISKQMFIPSTPAAVVPLFAPTTSDIWLNILWLISLMLSLGSALIGIFMKQWMQSYMTWTGISPPSSAVAVREYRHDCLVKWKFHVAMEMLPLLLQGALVLFGAGLVRFCFSLNYILGYVVCVYASLCIACVAVFTFLPLFSASSPCRSTWSVLLARFRRQVSRWALSQQYYLLTTWSGLFRFSREYAEKILQATLRDSSRTSRHGYTWDDWDLMLVHNAADDVGPSWEARAISALIGSSIHADVLTETSFQCLHRRMTGRHALGRQLNLADCCEAISGILGFNPNTKSEPMEVAQLWSNADLQRGIGQLSHALKKSIFGIICQSSENWINSSGYSVDEELILRSYVTKAIVFLLPLWSCLRETRDLNVDYLVLTLLVRLYHKEGKRYPLGTGWVEKVLIPQSVFTIYTQGNYEHVLPAPIDILAQWNAEEVESHTRIVTTIVEQYWSKNIGSIHTPAPIITTTLTLLATHQYTHERLGGSINNLLLKLDVTLDRAIKHLTPYDPYSTLGLMSAFNESLLWQAIYVLGSVRPLAFPDRLVRHLCMISDRIASVSATEGWDTDVTADFLDVMGNVQKQVMDEVWSRLLDSARRIGTGTSWYCPGFEPMLTV